MDFRVIRGSVTDGPWKGWGEFGWMDKKEEGIPIRKQKEQIFGGENAPPGSGSQVEVRGRGPTKAEPKRKLHRWVVSQRQCLLQKRAS